MLVRDLKQYCDCKIMWEYNCRGTNKEEADKGIWDQIDANISNLWKLAKLSTTYDISQ